MELASTLYTSFSDGEVITSFSTTCGVCGCSTTYRGLSFYHMGRQELPKEEKPVEKATNKRKDEKLPKAA